MSAQNLVSKFYRAATQNEISMNKYLSDSFIEDNNARCLGIEYDTLIGEKLRIVFIKFSSFDIYNGFAEVLYRQEAFINGDWRFLEILKTNIDGSDYYYSNPLLPSFGQLEETPFDEQNNLKQDLISEVAFFSDNLLKNKNGLPIGMNLFIENAIKFLISKNTK